jgi:hypothetical protein
MTAHTPTGEKATGAMPLAVFKARIVIVVFTAEPDGKFSESDAVFFLGVALGFFYLSNEARLHYLYLLKLKSTASREVSALILPS